MQPQQLSIRETGRRPTKRMILTQANVAAVPAPPTGRLIIHDARQPALVLQVTAHGARAFYLYRRVGGRPSRLRIGAANAIAVELARERVSELLGLMAGGRNPVAERRTARAESLFGEVFARYLTQYAKPRKRTWAEDQRMHDRHLAQWGRRQLSTIRRADVRELHRSMAETPYQANRLLALIRKVFNFAAGELDYAGDNPARHVQRFAEQSRDRYLRPDEAKRFFAALATMGADVQDYVRVALFTGARRANVLGMRWADVDLTANRWTISAGASKSGVAMTLPLIPDVATILRRRRAADPDGEHVFGSASEQGHMTDPKKAWKLLCEKAGLTNLHFHDLRRTLGSWQAAAGASLATIGRSLGHKSLQTTLVYSRLDLGAVRASVVAAATAIQRAGKPGKRAKRHEGR